MRLSKYFFGQVGGGGWEDELKNKTNLSQRLVEVEAELGNTAKSGNIALIICNIVLSVCNIVLVVCIIQVSHQDTASTQANKTS